MDKLAEFDCIRGKDCSENFLDTVFAVSLAGVCYMVAKIIGLLSFCTDCDCDCEMLHLKASLTVLRSGLQRFYEVEGFLLIVRFLEAVVIGTLASYTWATDSFLSEGCSVLAY